MLVPGAILACLLLVPLVSFALAQYDGEDGYELRYGNEEQSDDELPLRKGYAPQIQYLNASDEAFPHRIVGGRLISISKAKWQAAVIVNGRFECGGTIISRGWVVTAAHCIGVNSRFKVRVGSNFFRYGGQTRSVDLVVMHGGYNKHTFRHDIALLRLSRLLTYNSVVGNAKLASPKTTLKSTFTITGWGLTSQNGQVAQKLRAAVVQLVSRATCIKNYKGKGVIPTGTICAAASGTDSCEGDSGGPMEYNGVLYGVVSFGEGCARKGFPGVYTDVRYHQKWISKVVRRYNR